MANDKRQKTAKEPAARRAYDEAWRQAAAAWDAALRDPSVLSAIAAANAGQLEATTRIRDAFGAVLKTMNLASREDVAALAARLDTLEAKIDRLGDAVAARQAPRPRRRA